MISRIGDGTAPLGTTTVAMYIDERTVSGALVQSVALPTVTSGSVRALTLPPANPLLTLSVYQAGVPATVGMVTLSADGRFVSIAGMSVPSGTTYAQAAIAWTVGRVAYNAVIDTSTYVTGHTAGDVTTNAVSLDGGEFWFSNTGSSSATGYTVVRTQNLTCGVICALRWRGELYEDQVVLLLGLKRV